MADYSFPPPEHRIYDTFATFPLPLTLLTTVGLTVSTRKRSYTVYRSLPPAAAVVAATSCDSVTQLAATSSVYATVRCAERTGLAPLLWLSIVRLFLPRCYLQECSSVHGPPRLLPSHNNIDM